MTRVRFDVITADCQYPLTGEAAKGALLALFKEAPDLREVVRDVRFGCSRRTPQEGRIVQRGRFFDIRVNLCLKENKTRLASTSKAWLRVVTICGGMSDLSEGHVLWPKSAAANYAAFILFHEAAHIIYMRRHGRTTLGFKSAVGEEERFCDDWALKMLKRWNPAGAHRPVRPSRGA